MHACVCKLMLHAARRTILTTWPRRQSCMRFFKQLQCAARSAQGSSFPCLLISIDLLMGLVCVVTAISRVLNAMMTAAGLLAVAAVLVALAADGTAKSTPNIVFILSDE